MATTMHCGFRTLHCAYSRRHLHGQLIPWENHIHSTRSKLLVSELPGRTVENPRRSRLLRVSCKKRSVDVLEWSKTENQSSDGVIYQKGRESDDAVLNQLTCVMKFGGSSVASAERMREVTHLIRSFPEERPVIVLSAMGKTTNKLILAGEKAVSCGISNVSNIEELSFVKELHLRTADELGVERSIVSTHLEELEQLLKGIAQVKELTLRTKDYLVSFGECMSTRIFAAYLNKVGVKARQYDAFEIGFVTTDDFTNADILEATYPAVAKRLHSEWVNDPAIPVVTSFFGKGLKSCAITTLDRGGRDLTAGAIGKALSLREFQKVQMVASVFFSVAGDDSERKPTSDNVKADKKPTFNPFKEIKSTEDWMKFVGVLHFGSSVMINQLILAFRVRVGICRSQDSHSNWGEILCLCTRIFPLACDASSGGVCKREKKSIKLGPLLVLEVASCKDNYWVGKNTSRLSSMRTTKSGNPEWYLYLLMIQRMGWLQGFFTRSINYMLR